MTDRVTAHAESVAIGDTPSGELHKLACLRHLNDLERQNTEDFPYYYDPLSAGDVIEFAETLTIAEGDSPKPVILIPEQAFDIGCTFGWKKTSNGKRRFRRRYKSMAKQNGKTFENGIMGAYVAAFSNYRYGKLFTVATKKRQARAAWEEIAKFIKIDPDLSEYFSVKEYNSIIKCPLTECTIEALSREAGLEHGFRSIFASIDEIHQHRDNRVYKTIYNGTRALPETLVSMITTRGDKLNSFCKEMDDYAVKILKGFTTAEDFFADIYALGEKDDIWNPDNWFKSNPFIANDPELFKVLMADAKTAKDMGGSDLRDFLTMSLNIWVNNTDDMFINADKWKDCGSDKTLEDFSGAACWVGLDLSSGGDLTTLSLEFDDLPDEQIYIFSHSFMPKGRLEEHIETDTAPYDLWHDMGLITVTGGDTDFKNDYKFIIRKLKEICSEYGLKIKGIGIDPHNADGVLSDLEEFGCPVVTITQSCKSLNDATRDIQLLVKSGKVGYDRRNELLTWSFLNARTVKNSFDEIKVDKNERQNYSRIDPVDAAIDAHALKLMMAKQKPAVDANAELEDYLKKMGWK